MPFPFGLGNSVNVFFTFNNNRAGDGQVFDGYIGLVFCEPRYEVIPKCLSKCRKKREEKKNRYKYPRSWKKRRVN